MNFYKILRQQNKKESAFYETLDKNNYIVGNFAPSFAVKYTPETYNSLLANDNVFNEYSKKGIKQLFVTNQKFIAIMKKEKLFNLKAIDCKFVEGSIDDFLDEDEFELSETIEYLVDEFEYTVKEITYITEKSNKYCILQKNGVIGFDSGLSTSEYSDILKLIDTLNLGLKVLKL